MTTKNFEERIRVAGTTFHRVVPFTGNEVLLRMDFTQSNGKLTPEILKDTDRFIRYINDELRAAKATYGIGGYMEKRFIYSRSELFGKTVLNSSGGPIPNPSRGEGSGSPYDHLLSENDFIEDPEFGYYWADPKYYRNLKEYAFQNRKSPTPAEEILWQAVKSKKLGEHKFRRQHIIDKYIADLVCLDKKLIIEIDGLIHQLPDNIESDTARTKTLEELGFTVIRVTNDQVLKELNSILDKILQKSKTLPSIKRNFDLSPPFGGQGATTILPPVYNQQTISKYNW